MTSNIRLPAELWLQILHWAGAIARSNLASGPEPLDINVAEARQTLQTRLNVILVCQLWRKIGTEMLYHEVWVRHGASMLVQALEGGKGVGEGNGKFVRCIHLSTSPADLIDPSTSTILADRIIECCPNVQILLKDRQDSSGNATNTRLSLLSLPSHPLPLSLRRLDWCYNWTSKDQHLLQFILSYAPNLEYLSLVGPAYRPFRPQNPVTLPALTTLRISAMDTNMIQQINTWSIPFFTRLIVNPSRSADFYSFMNTRGDQVQTLDFGAGSRLLRRDFLGRSLAACPKLRELSLYIMFTGPTNPAHNFPHHSLECVRLHSRPNPLFDGREKKRWTHIVRHFSLFTGTTLPALTRLVLHGQDWVGVTNDPRFKEIYQRLQTRLVTLEFPNGVPLCIAQ